uniref:MULE transposase domain-containing protein n=1 Tax=Mycena chlorophos TaxID=658473 RepID=A0ABQ0LCF2_MYCCL|nr:predicted protein [Mycena chlorophos]
MSSRADDSECFDAAEDLSAKEIKQYRAIMFPAALGDPDNLPHFSTENAPLWMTARGYALYQECDPADPITYWLDDATVRELKAYRELVIGPTFLSDIFFSAEEPKNWAAQAPFNTWRRALADQELRGRPQQRSPSGSSRSVSQATFSSGRSLSAAHFPPQSRSESRASVHSFISSAASSRATSPHSRATSPYSSHVSSRAVSRGVSRAVSHAVSRAASPHHSRLRSESSDAVFQHSVSISSSRLRRSPSVGSHRNASLAASWRESPPPVAPSELGRESPDLASSPKPNSDKGKGKGKGKAKSASKSASKGKGKADRPDVKITRQHYVDRIEPISVAKRTWPIIPDVGYFLDVQANKQVLFGKEGKPRPIDAYIRAEVDLDSRGGSTGLKDGDSWVYVFPASNGKGVRCRRAVLTCMGVGKCEHASPDLFVDCERYEPDPAGMQDLWFQELDANEREAASVDAILSRFYIRVTQSKCKKAGCDGVPILIRLRNGVNHYGKIYFVGCSKWVPEERWLHIYFAIPSNVDEQAFKFVLENNGRLPGPEAATLNLNLNCILTVHPRLGLQECRTSLFIDWITETEGHQAFSHIALGIIKSAQIVPHECDSELVVFIPVRPPENKTHKYWYQWFDEYKYQAVVVPRYPHSHPVHPESKPSATDDHLLDQAMSQLGSENLTVQRLLNGKSFSTMDVYGGKRISEVSPAFADVRKIRDRITAHKKQEFPRGTDWEGVQHHIETKESTLPVSQRYIHAAIKRGDYKMIVTLHPQLAPYIHTVLALIIDYTFKHVEGNMDEWEVVAFSERFKIRILFATLYCDRKSRPSFEGLFTEFFDIVYQVTGQRLAMRPFYPDANCRVMVMDGEVAQAQGLGDFLVKYNQPAISGINEIDPLALVPYCLKTCTIHFQRHIDDMARQVPKEILTLLKSILGLSSQAAIDQWHADVAEAGKTYEVVKNWYAQKLAHPWILATVNAFLSKIHPDDYKITPKDTNAAESAHAAINAETGTRLSLLSGILKKQIKDNKQVDEIRQISRDGIMRKRWNGPTHRERHSEQRKTWAMKQASERNQDLTAFDSLTEEREDGEEERKLSMARTHALSSDLRELNKQIKAQRGRNDLKEEAKLLRQEIKAEKKIRDEWSVRRAEVDGLISALREGPLKGVQLRGRIAKIRENRNSAVADELPMQADSEEAELVQPLAAEDPESPMPGSPSRSAPRLPLPADYERPDPTSYQVPLEERLEPPDFAGQFIDYFGGPTENFAALEWAADIDIDMPFEYDLAELDAVMHSAEQSILPGIAAPVPTVQPVPPAVTIQDDLREYDLRDHDSEMSGTTPDPGNGTAIARLPPEFVEGSSADGGDGTEANPRPRKRGRLGSEVLPKDAEAPAPRCTSRNLKDHKSDRQRGISFYDKYT